MPITASTTYTGKKLEPAIRPELAVTIAVRLPANAVYPKGTVLGEVSATPGLFKAYATGSADGSQIPKAVVPYDVSTDASGNIYFGTAAVSEFGQFYPSVDVYIAGYFYTADLPQTGIGAIDANAITTPQLVLKQGTLAAGLVKLI